MDFSNNYIDEIGEPKLQTIKRSLFFAYYSEIKIGFINQMESYKLLNMIVFLNYHNALAHKIYAAVRDCGI